MNNSANNIPADVRPLKLGVEVYGLDLNNRTDNSTINWITELVTKHKFVVFRNQGVVSGDKQIEITKWFGEIETLGFEKHPRSPSKAVLRVSNDAKEGFKRFGVSGFHIDGFFMDKPNSHSIYHIVNVPSQGTTEFISLSDVYNRLTDSQKALWDVLWLATPYDHIRGCHQSPGVVIKPLVYPHPVTKVKTLCIHMGKTGYFIKNYGTDMEEKTSKEETKLILEEISQALCPELQYSHQWKKGDFIITDNLALGHLATKETQAPIEEIGLRVMHRTIVKGKHELTKS